MYLNDMNEVAILVKECLTITWDVFELVIVAASDNASMFNYNMGCI